MPQTDTTADRVAMRLAHAICENIWGQEGVVKSERDAVAAALSSHGLRELIEANEHTYQAMMGRYDRQEALSEQRKLRDPTALLGEGEKEKQWYGPGSPTDVDPSS